MPSALYGYPPNNENDFFQIRGYLRRVIGLPENKINPAKGLTNRILPPPGNPPYHPRGPSLVAAMSIIIFLTALIGFSRLGLRYFRRDLRVGLDDLFIVPGILGAIAFYSVIISTVNAGGGGKHIWDITYVEQYWFFQLNGINNSVFWISISMTKISIVFFNRRLTGLTSRAWMFAHHTMLFILASFCISATCVSVFTCSPGLPPLASLRYIGRIPPAQFKPLHCLDYNKIRISLATVHIITDFALLSVPLIILSKIHVTTNKKIRLGFMFSIGSLSCIGSVMRMANGKHHSRDSTWGYPSSIAWTVVDLFFASTAASLPILNSVIPSRWRSSFDSPRHYRFSPFKRSKSSSSRQPIISQRLGNKERLKQQEPQQLDVYRSRPDGTIIESLDDEEKVERHSLPSQFMKVDDERNIDKDSFTRRTEKRWHEACVQEEQRTSSSGSGSPEGGRGWDDGASTQAALGVRR